MSDLFGLNIITSDAVPEDMVAFVPLRERDEDYEAWVRRCAILRVTPARVTYPATTMVTYELDEQ